MPETRSPPVRRIVEIHALRIVIPFIEEVRISLQIPTKRFRWAAIRLSTALRFHQAGSVLSVSEGPRFAQFLDVILGRILWAAHLLPRGYRSTIPTIYLMDGDASLPGVSTKRELECEFSPFTARLARSGCCRISIREHAGLMSGNQVPDQDCGGTIGTSSSQNRPVTCAEQILSQFVKKCEGMK